MRLGLAALSMLALASCAKEPDATKQAETPAPAPAAPSTPAAPAMAGTDLGGGMMMTAVDPGGFTEDGFTFHTRPGSKHVVRLQAPGTDTWRPAASGEPTVKEIGSHKETTPDGKAALVFEYEALQSGNVAIEFERLEDGEVEGKRTVRFMVH